MIFARFLFFVLVASRVVLASGGLPFTVAGAEGQQLADLKHRAVLEYLQAQLGDRFQSYQAQVTPEFAEGYILDYKVTRMSGSRMQLSGHLDSDALKGWLRLAETKRGGGSTKPFLLISSAIPGLSIEPRTTAQKVREGAMGQLLLQEANATFAKVNVKVGVASSQNFSLQQPPRTDGEMRALREYGISEGYSAAVWVHFVPCRSCGGSRMDILLYNLNQGRRVAGNSEELSLGSNDFSNAARIKTAFKKPFQELRNELEGLVTSGALLSAAYRVTIEGLKGYRAFKAIDAKFEGSDYINTAALKKSMPQTAEFEVLTSLSAEELSSRLESESFPGFRLRAERVDNRNILMRYSR